MKRFALLGLALAVLTLGGTAASAATTYLNIDLSGATVGNPIPLNPASGNPVTAFGYFGGYGTPPLGTGVVSNVAGIGHAADLTTDPNNASDGALYLDTSLNIIAPKISLSFDINVLAQAGKAAGYPQFDSPDNSSNPVLFGVRLYSSTVANWATTIDFSPTSATGGIFGFRNSDATALQSIGTYTVGTAEHVQVNLDYTTGLADAYVNNSLVYSGYPLRGGINPGQTTSELFMFLDGSTDTAESNIGNEVAVGNLQIVETVPLPASVWGGGSLMLGALAFMSGKRLMRKNAATA